MTTFVDDDRDYLDWVASHPGGFVVNCGRNPSPAYLILHRAVCKFIRTATRSNWTTGEYIKVCSEDLGDLGRWASEQIGGELQPCRGCSPLPGPSTGGRTPGKRTGEGGKRGGTGAGGGASRFITAKNVVDFLAALIAVIGGIVAFIQWLK